MTKKALILGAGIVLVLAMIFAAGCTGTQASEGTVVQAPALGGYDVALAIGDAPDNNKLVTEKAVYDALAELRKEIAANANSGGIMVMGSGGGGSSTVVNNNAVWGKVTGKLADQTDLMTELANFLDSREFSQMPANSFLVVNPSSSNGGFGAVESIPADKVKVEEGKTMDPTALPVANKTSAGIVKIGSGLSVTEDGTIGTESAAPTWDEVIGKPFSSIGFGLLNTSDTLSVDTSVIATKDDLTTYNTHLANDDIHVTVANKTAWDAKQDKIDSSNKLSADNVDDSSAANKFVTAANKTAWDAKQDKIDSSNKLSADNVDDSSAANKFVTAANKTAWDAKQEKLTAGEGITIVDNTISATSSTPSWSDITDKPFSTLGTGLTNTSGVLAVDMTDIANKTELAGKVDKVAGSSLVADTKISGYDTHVADDDIHVTAANKTAWDAKQDADKLVTSFQTTPDDTHYPSEKLVNDTLTFMKKEIFDSIYPIGSYAFGVKPTMGEWTEVTGDRAIWIKNTEDDGTLISQALPNINGSLTFHVDGDAASGNEVFGSTGAFSYSTKDSKYASKSNYPFTPMNSLTFNATDSNPIYQDGANVQPNAYVMKVWKRTA